MRFEKGNKENVNNKSIDVNYSSNINKIIINKEQNSFSDDKINKEISKIPGFLSNYYQEKSIIKTKDFDDFLTIGSNSEISSNPLFLYDYLNKYQENNEKFDIKNKKDEHNNIENDKKDEDNKEMIRNCEINNESIDNLLTQNIQDINSKNKEILIDKSASKKNFNHDKNPIVNENRENESFMKPFISHALIKPIKKVSRNGEKFLLPRTGDNDNDHPSNPFTKSSKDVYVKKKITPRNIFHKSSIKRNNKVDNVGNSDLSTNNISTIISRNDINIKENLNEKKSTLTPKLNIRSILLKERILQCANETKNNKMIKNDPSNINIEGSFSNRHYLTERLEFLHAYGRDLPKKRENQAQIFKQNRQEEESKQCTFKPKINPLEKLANIFTETSDIMSNYLNTSTISTISHIDRIYNWHTYVKEKYTKLKNRKRTAQERMNQNDDLTFQPTISKIMPNFDKINASGLGEKEKMYIERLERAKKKREEKYRKLNPDYNELYEKIVKRPKTRSIDTSTVNNSFYSFNLYEGKMLLDYHTARRNLHNELIQLHTEEDM